MRHSHYYTVVKDSVTASVKLWHDHDEVGLHDHDINFRLVNDKKVINVSVPVKAAHQ